MHSFLFSAEYGRVNASSLNVRVGPSTKNEKACVVQNATELEIKERRGAWYRVNLDGVTTCRGKQEGWVYGSPLFRPEGKYATAQVVQAPNGLRVRASESSSSKIQCNLKQGDVVSVIGPSEKNPNWIRINTEKLPGCNTKEAFVYREFIEEFRSYTYVEKNPPVPDGMDPLDGLETEGGDCENCDKPIRTVFRDFIDFIRTSYNAQNPAKPTMVESYSRSEQVDQLIQCAQKNVKPQPTGYCYRYVKNALLGGNLSDEYLNGISAATSGPALKSEGYVNLLADSEWREKIKSPYDAPRGSILVFDGGPYGHIEIKMGDIGEGGFISDYYSESARTGRASHGLSGRGRTLIGVYVKDLEGEKNDKPFVCPRPRS